MIKVFCFRVWVFSAVGIVLAVAINAYGGFIPAMIPLAVVSSVLVLCEVIAVAAGSPVMFRALSPHKEFVLARRINSELSLVNLARGDEVRLVRGVPLYIAEGEAFIPRGRYRGRHSEAG